MDQGDGGAQVLFVVAHEATAAGEPGQRSFDPPPLGNHDGALGLMGALDDLQTPASGFTDLGGGRLALVATIGEDHLDEGKECAGSLVQDQIGAVAIQNIGGMDNHVQQQSERIGQGVILDVLDLFARVVPNRVEGRPPFSAERTL